MGNKIILIIGDFTGVIGDTSDKDSERPMLQKESVEKNLKTYIKQASKIINTDTAEVYHNSEWLEKLNYIDIGRQADAFSLNEFISRENIDRRLSEGKRISLRELLYPLMQGYDSARAARHSPLEPPPPSRHRFGWRKFLRRISLLTPPPPCAQ